MGSSFENEGIGRREVLKGAVASSLGLTVAANAVGGAETESRASLVQQENKRTGTTDWQLTRVRINEGKFRTSLIEGYCSHQSIAAGQTLSVHVSTRPARQFTLDVYRMGYYGGAGARHVQQFGPVEGTSQPVPEMTALPERLRECRWEPSVEFTIPDDWLSGVYLGNADDDPGVEVGAVLAELRDLHRA